MDIRALRGRSLTDGSAGMRWTASAFLVLTATLVPAFHGVLSSAAGGRGAYAVGTLVLLLSVGALPLVWPRDTTIPRRPRLVAACILLLAGLPVLVWTATRLLPVIFAGPL